MSKAESAELILKLYDLRREEKMREARAWFPAFSPNSAQEVLHAMINPETSAKIRMVISYWDMAASFVNHGAIDEDMFNESAGESVMVFAKVHPYLSEVRETMGNPNFLKNLETLIMRKPDAEALLESRREMMKKMAEARAQMAQSA